MGFFKSIIQRHNEKILKRNDICNDLIARCNDALLETRSLFSAPSIFVDPIESIHWKERHCELFDKVKSDDIYKLKKASNYLKLIAAKDSLLLSANTLSDKIHSHNEKVAELKTNYVYSLIGDVEGRRLDRQQMTCIAKEAHNHLVIAGAGTGKTTTVVGRIKFLLKSYKFLPEDILVLSFTNASASEMSERIKKETGYNIAASTFHKLGLEILKQSEGIVPKICTLPIKKFIAEQIELNKSNNAYYKKLCFYLIDSNTNQKSEFSFKSQSEYDEYLRLNPPTTINNEAVKSYGEMEIANFLEENGVSYIYETPYRIDTRDKDFAQYIPDFYLPEYDIYIEYFGIDKNGNVPSYFTGKNGMNPSQTYQASMQWKRNTHRVNNTTLIECFAYEKAEGTLLENLSNNLKKQSVKFKPQTAEKLWSKISSNNPNLINGTIELFCTLINLIKSNGYTILDVRKLSQNRNSIPTSSILLDLLEPIYNAYCSYLSNHNEIDFNDMINKATYYVKCGKYINPYRYVIVDEYQDIAKSRFLLLKALRESRDYDLFCVGDDWQSIYRFAGSDIGYILNFEQYWGKSEISRIETTYRFTKSLIDISGSFIMQNPAQLKKSIQGKKESLGFSLGEISAYNEKYAVDFMLNRLEDLPKNSTVFFIGRYSYDAKLLDNNSNLKCEYNTESASVKIIYSIRPDLNIKFITAHKSKGLQADYVFIINNKNSRMGFPSKIQDAPILNLLLENYDDYPFSEERRLFYVALTRAKTKVFLLTIDKKESTFVQELKCKYLNEIRNEAFECPICGGKLIKRSGQYGDFFGCSNYHSNGCTYKRKIYSKK